MTFALGFEVDLYLFKLYLYILCKHFLIFVDILLKTRKDLSRDQRGYFSPSEKACHSVRNTRRKKRI